MLKMLSISGDREKIRKVSIQLGENFNVVQVGELTEK